MKKDFLNPDECSRGTRYLLDILLQPFSPLHVQRKPNIMDNMIAIMERYTNNLEELVDERTQELQKEKAKTEQLLHRMLPP